MRPINGPSRFLELVEVQCLVTLANRRAKLQSLPCPLTAQQPLGLFLFRPLKPKFQMPLQARGHAQKMSD